MADVVLDGAARRGRPRRPRSTVAQQRHRRLARRRPDGPAGGGDPDRGRVRRQPRTGPSSSTPPGSTTHDLVLAMDADNLADIGGRHATGSRLFRDFDPVEPGGEVPDPYYGGDAGFEEVLTMVERTGRGRSSPQLASASWAAPRRDPPAAGRQARRGAPRRRRGGHGPGRRRRHRDRHPAPAQQRHHGADEDAARTRPADFFDAEAHGLRWLGEAGGVQVPEVLAVDHECLILALGRAREEHHRGRGRASAGRWPPPTTPAPRRTAWTATATSARLPLPNRPADTWAEFYATAGCCPTSSWPVTGARSRPRAPRRSRRSSAGCPAWCPRSRRRGSTATCGTATCCGASTRRVCVIDPAAHGGHRETDLAMLALFGLPHLPRVLDAYAGGRRRSPTAGRTGSACTSSSRCWCTPACSVAATAPAPPRSPRRYA